MDIENMFDYKNLVPIQNIFLKDERFLCLNKGIIKFAVDGKSSIRKKIILADIECNEQLLSFENYSLKIYSNGILTHNSICNSDKCCVALEIMVGQDDTYILFEICTINSVQIKPLLKNNQIGIFFKPIEIKNIKFSDILHNQVDHCHNLSSALGLDGIYLNEPKILKFQNMVVQALIDNKPLSCVRVGDGEGRLLGYPDIFSDFDICYQLINYQFGGSATDSLTSNYSKYILSKQIFLLRKLVVDSILNADYVGIPVADFFRALKEPKIEELDGLVGYIVGLQYSMLLRRDLDYDKILGTNIFQLLCAHTNFLTKIINSARRIFYINDKNFDYSFNLLKINKPIIHISISAHSAWDSDGSLYGQFPFQYKYTCSQISSYGSLNGDLFLIGAGVLGKHYANHVKKKGGVGLDVGSIFDSWAKRGLPYAIDNEVPGLESIPTLDLEHFAAK